MLKLKVSLFLIAILTFKTSISQDKTVIINYINTYRDLAISEMQRTGVPAAIKLAQGIHETGAGTSVLVKKSNNHFGIKCKSDWTGESVSHTDDAPNECFRKYPTPEDSYKDHSDFLRKSARYSFLFKLDPTDYQGWAWGLKKAGYATNIKYSQVLIKLIEEYHLEDYTLIAMGKMKPQDAYLAKFDNNQSEQNVEVVAAVEKKDETVKTQQPEPAIVVYKEEAKPAKTNFPDGEFKINETRVIYARKGVSYLSIAEKYKIPLSRIFEFNDMKQQEEVDRDQLIYLMRKRKTGNDERYVVKDGDSVFDIAQVQAIRLESLMEYNNLKPDSKLLAGTVLYLRGKSPVAQNSGLGTR